jgi:hypothetical protein
MRAQQHLASTHRPYSPPARPKPPAFLDPASDRLADITVLPAQFFNPPDGAYKVRGEFALLCAVLEDAVACFQKGAATDGRRAQRLAREAEAWFFSDDHHWPFSFVNICAVLGLDPEYIRLGLKRWSRRHLAGRPKTRRQASIRRPLKLTA